MGDDRDLRGRSRLDEVAACAGSTRLAGFVLGTNDLAKEMRARLTAAHAVPADPDRRRLRGPGPGAEKLKSILESKWGKG